MSERADRLTTIAQWLQHADDELSYDPDGLAAQARESPRPQYYILVGHVPVPVADVLTWARAFEQSDARRVAETSIGEEVRVSTVFLGLDHNHWGSGPPILFESMIFGGACNNDMERCATWEEAETMHQRMVERAAAPVGEDMR